MKSKSVILFSIFVVIGVLAFFTVQITNRSIERIYKNSHTTTFQLLSEIADNYVKRDLELNRMEIGKLKNKGKDILRDYFENNYIALSENLYGIWIFSDSLLKSSSRFPGQEEIILDFYRRELKDKDYGTLVNLEGEPFYLVNIISESYSILLLSKSVYGETENITQVLDSLVSTSNLVYFAIVDEDESPIIYSSIYEGFLPVEGEGSHIIETPDGKIFQLEEANNEKTVIAGFSMRPLERVIAFNGVFLLIVIAGFSVFLGFLIFNLTRTERYRIDKQREIRHLEEIGALSSGFSHEVRNSLNTLSLLARSMEGEQGNILKQEVKRMNLVMDSIKLLILSEVDKEDIDIDNTIVEAISLTDNKNNKVEIKLESAVKLKIQANRALLVSAFSNIFKNAVEADADKVRILMRKVGNIVRIVIIDNGKGIEKDSIKRVFEPFYSSKRQSGIGLYLARKIIEYHGGSIKLESGKETRVDILLPIKD
ncbi:HAMP domain-containing histidine kinase [candidate division WOR-3 bacterium]|nr:HAMP domain-containing histidine kinase [candidate division WOR-3 bacterium]